MSHVAPEISLRTFFSSPSEKEYPGVKAGDHTEVWLALRGRWTKLAALLGFKGGFRGFKQGSEQKAA